ncbi:MAG: YegP family protein [Roseateles sp.]|uniref:YegP family protein n=1 Tax=Roseateles sp. TaxID=1971397 RepID=UPI0039EB20E6
MSGKFEITKSKNDKFMFNLKAGNGEVILTSQMYEAKTSAQQGIDSVKANAPLDERYERATSSSGKPYFNLKAANGQVIGNSEMYSSASAMEGGIASVKKNAPDAQVVDLSA